MLGVAAHGWDFVAVYRVRLIFPGSSGGSTSRSDTQAASLDHAKSLARHEFDLERYLAARREPPGSAPVAVQILEDEEIVWQMTGEERAQERGRFE